MKSIWEKFYRLWGNMRYMSNWINVNFGKKKGDFLRICHLSWMNLYESKKGESCVKVGGAQKYDEDF